VNLLQKGEAERFSPRPPAEVAALLLAAYGKHGDERAVQRGLEVVAGALTEGDLCKAMIAALHLRLPAPPAEGVRRLAVVQDFLAKYDPDEPRDWHGRWAREEGRGNSNSRESRHSERADDATATGSRTWPAGPVGGALTEARYQPVEGVEPAEPPPIPPEDDPDRDDRGENREEREPDGSIRQIATPNAIREALKRVPGSGTPTIWVLVPSSRSEPILIGSSPQQGELSPQAVPPGYSWVQFVGTPQETIREGETTNHAEDSVEAALEFCRTYRVRRIFFNRGMTTSTGGLVRNPLRPDVMAELEPDPGFGPQIRYIPYESLSPGQDLESRIRQLNLHPSIGRVQGQHYRKLLEWLWQRLGGTALRSFLFRS
jgi:hypothetical protein